MIRYAKIMKNDVANGNGVCVSLWCQGCPHRCPGCHNKETWSYTGGIEGNMEDILEEIVSSIDSNGIQRNFSVLGGEPLDTLNLLLVKLAINKVRESFPNVKIYLWTGYTLEDLTEQQLDAIKEVDVLIDGRFEEDLKDLTLELRGSSNQRILNREDIYGEIKKRSCSATRGIKK